MLRLMRVVIGVVCVAIVLSEAVGLALLWARGQLNAEVTRDVLALLRGQGEAEPEPDPVAETEQVSMEQVIEARAVRALDLNSRENELNLLKSLVDERREALLAEKTEFERQRRAFSEQLDRMKADMTSEATEQARGVLLALQPGDAVKSLMQLDLPQNVVLLGGMPPKSIGRILAAMQGGGDEERERGGEIFEALSRGEPSRAAVDAAQAELGAGTQDAGRP